MALLSVKDLSVCFHTRLGLARAVDRISFDLETGRTLGIVGESGSGKTVTAHSLLGLLPSPPARIENGSALFDGIDLLRAPEDVLRAVRGNRISMIFQDPLSSLNPYLTIGTQLIEPLRVHGGLSRKAATERAMAGLDEVGISHPAERLHSYPHEFSGGMRQRVMIAMALSTAPDILIADEPTTALDVTIQAQILDLIRHLQGRHGIATIFISHNLGVIAGIADEVMVMRRGVCVERGSAEDVFYRPAHVYTRQLLASIPTRGKPTPPPAESPDAAPLLKIDGIRVSYAQRKAPFGRRPTARIRAVDDVSLELHRGEILGLVGESGSGKSTMARTLLRLVEPDSGSLTMEGVPLGSLRGSALRAIRPRLQMIFQDPYSSLDPRMTVHECLREALLQRAPASREQVLRESTQLMLDVGLEPAQIGKYPHEFSGGQRQRIAIARALAMRPELIVADEPVSSLDVTVQALILDLLLELNRRRGVTLIIISHDLSVIRYVSDRTAVMYRGRIVELGATEDLFREPKHGYTRALLSAIPIPDPRVERSRRRTFYAEGEQEAGKMAPSTQSPLF
ncbi:MAG: ABC transporter ATP-binding protein [Gammaproteobacteria bacterium]|nr:ABC transporter ATP-binding protein [Gammaproteobacteria bacterium]